MQDFAVRTRFFSTLQTVYSKTRKDYHLGEVNLNTFSHILESRLRHMAP